MATKASSLRPALALLAAAALGGCAAQPPASPPAPAAPAAVPVDNFMAPPDPAVVAAATAAAEAGGSGPWKATMLMEPSLPTHTVYRPRDLGAFGATRRLPIILWGNGACVNIGNRFRYFLTELASHGYFAVAIGPIGAQYLEGQSSLSPPRSPPPAQAQPPAQRPEATQASQLIDALDWAIAENGRGGGPYFGKLDTSKVAIMGQSCGGLQAIAASADRRTTTTMVWNSGTFPADRPPLPGTGATKESLKKLNGPVAYISGDQRDIAYVNADADFDAISHVPVFRAYKKGVGHIGTFRTPNGGDFGKVGVAWLDWHLKGDMAAAPWFKGRNCRLCTDPQWVVRKKGID